MLLQDFHSVQPQPSTSGDKHVPDNLQPSGELHPPGYDEHLTQLIQAALQEDIGDGDHTTLSCIPPGARGRAVLKIKQPGILAGMEVAEKILRMRDPETLFVPLKKDGEAMQAGERAFEAESSIHTLLTCERLILNCMQRMSGIATLTRRYVDRLRGYHTRVLDIRKTTPNFRLLEKEAVRIGGGLNHRFGLFDMILLKDNHIDFCGSIEAAVEKAIHYRDTRHPQLKIEVETRSIDDVRRVLAMHDKDRDASIAFRAGVDRILLDNLTPAQVAEALHLIGGRFETEASGGINLENLEEYARTGVDFVSIGGLIHQAQSIDLSLKAEVIAH